MSNNVPKKLTIKAELLRHLETAKGKMLASEPSSVVKVTLLMNDIDGVNATLDPMFDTKRWEEILS